MIAKTLRVIFFCFLSFSIRAELATFAGGCFWCMEPPFEKLEGVKSVVSGYMGGAKEQANYKLVSSGGTRHLEVVQVDFDPKKVSYEKLVSVFWRNIDPTQTDGQFVDKGPQYLSAIFYHNKAQKSIAEKSKKSLEESKKFSKPIFTPIRKSKEFYPAEEYHQDYYKKSTFRYKLYRVGSGRDSFLKEHWGKN
ncbi:MAG: peptide-methionine (S)-S-oxide reductase MsrA [Halobacteriovoraceae bacterium]|nr:peptide-methionine (S)-S-oxide reductase MsrA [Halobacteriovoraceae bacterium]